MGAVTTALLAGCLLQVQPLQHCSTAALQHVFTMGKLGAELMFALLVTSHITCVTLYTCVLYTTHDSWSWRHSDDQLAGRGVCVIAGAGLVL